jgi:hypothetical protein
MISKNSNLKEESKNQERIKEDISFTSIANLIRIGKNMKQIADFFMVPKQNINYYISLMKKKGMITKIGYGTWEVNEVKMIEDSTKVTNNFKIIKYKRLKEILKKNNMYHCVFCSSSLINIHHLKPKKEGGGNEITNIIPICPNHHSYIHNFGINEQMKRKLDNYFIKIKTIKELIPKEGIIRGHAFMWKVRFNKIDKINWREILSKKNIEYKEIGKLKFPSIVFNGKKIWLGKKNIIIFETNSFFGINSIESKKLAVFELLETIRELLEYFGIEQKNIKFTTRREHYSLIKNELANQCNKNGEKINVYNEKGYWFCIDDSYNLGEMETLGSIENEPMETNIQVQKWWNDNKKHNFEVTPTFLMENINRVTQNQLMFNQNLESHISSVKQLGNSAQANATSVELLAEVICTLKEEVLNLNEEIKKLNETRN